MSALRERPKGVTIAIPNWNHEYLLGRSVGSALRAVALLKEQHVSAEVLVIDDFSRDGSVTLLRQLEALYFEQGLRIKLKPHNSGLVGARSTALQEARYRYMLFLDADDEVLPENLHIFYRTICETGAALVYGNLLYLNPQGQPQDFFSAESFQPRLFEDNYISAFALIDTLQVLETDAYFSEHDLLEDWFRNAHLAANGRLVVFVPVEIGYYYALSNSLIVGRSSETEARQRARAKRVFDQLGIRQENLLRTKHLRYHPELGFI
jgi:glycosyltransferase involved in cell wall biosynthesis